MKNALVAALLQFFLTLPVVYLNRVYYSRGDVYKRQPVPIPNTEVKLTSADNTWRVTAREDR